MRFNPIVGGVALAGAVAGTGAYAADLKAPFELETAQVLPSGVRNPRFKNLFMSVEDKFNGAGAVEPLGQKLNKRVSWGDILQTQATEFDRNMIRGVLADSDNGVSDPTDEGSPGFTTGQVNTFADVKVPVLAWGLSERWTLALAVPVMKVDISAATGFSRSEDGQKFIDAVCETNPEKCNDAARKLNDAVNQKLTRLGYEPVRSRTVSGVGDLKLVNKYLVHHSARDQVALRGELTLPTGTAPNADQAVDVPTGDGQWDVGAGVIWDHRFYGDLRWNTYAGYTAQLPDRLARRLPASATDSLSADKETLKRDLGDVVSAGTSMTLDFPSTGLSVGAGYGYQSLAQTTFQGSAFASERYRWLEAETPAQRLHSATVMGGFSTIEWYKQKRFALPMQANMAYSRPLAGVNTTRNDVVSAEVVLFF